MRIEDFRPHYSQDTGIPSGMPGIQDQTAQSVGRERSREAKAYEFHLPVPENDPRTELLQDFQAKVNRWHDIFYVAFFFATLAGDHKREETTESIHMYSGYGIALKLTRRGYKVQEDEERVITSQEYHIPLAARLGNTEYADSLRIWAEAAAVYDKARPAIVKESGFYIEIYSEPTKPTDRLFFHDPYNNRPFSGLRAGIRKKPQSDIPYDFFVDVYYKDDIVNPEVDTRRGTVIERAAFFEADVPILGTIPPEVRREIHVDRGEDKHSLLVRESDNVYYTLLSGNIDEHAKALLDFADSLIPHIQPQLPEPAAVREQ